MYIARSSSSNTPKAAPGGLPSPPQPSYIPVVDLVSLQGVADPYRQQARMKLLALQLSDPSPTQVELTALTLAEKDLKISGGVVPRAGLEGFAKQSEYLARMAAAGLGVTTQFAPMLAQVLNELDGEKLFTPMQHVGGNHFHYLGQNVSDLYLANKAAGLESYAKEYEVGLAGLYSSNEQQSLMDCLKWLDGRIGKDNVRKYINSISINTFLGETTSAEGEKKSTIAGLSDGPNIALERAYLTRPIELRHYLCHELGHSMDVQLAQGTGMAYRTDAGDTPFGRSADPADCASGYATVNPREDFSESLAFLVDNWNECQSQPQIALHGRGKLGEKLAWILENGFGMKVPPKDPRTEQILAAVEEGRSPFGWTNAQGQVVGAKSEYQAAIKDFLRSFDPRSNQCRTETYLDPNRKDYTQRAWLFQMYCGTLNPAASPVNPLGTETAFADLRRSAEIDAQLANRGSQAEALKHEKAGIFGRLQQAMERGKDPLYQELKQRLEESKLAEQFPQLSTYLDLARRA